LQDPVVNAIHVAASEGKLYPATIGATSHSRQAIPEWVEENAPEANSGGVEQEVLQA
jgi:hypothetical protein